MLNELISDVAEAKTYFVGTPTIITVHPEVYKLIHESTKAQLGIDSKIAKFAGLVLKVSDTVDKRTFEIE